MSSDNPRLVDTTFQNYMFHTLQKCHQHKLNTYSWVLNICIFVLFVSITGFVLYNCYKKKLSPEEQKQMFVAPVAQQKVTQENRQAAFDNYETQDDHAMHITGIVKDQNGKKYYIVKIICTI